MDFSLSAIAFLKNYFDIKNISGQEKFLAVSAVLCNGVPNAELRTQQVRKAWSRTSFGISYHPDYYRRARTEGWVDASGSGKFILKSRGLSHLESIASQKPFADSLALGLSIFIPGETHSFDRFIRALLKRAQNEVKIADSYVDGSIFDNLLDEIPDGVKTSLVYRKKQGSFDSRVARFSVQYRRFGVRQYSKLHDRFLVIDGTGYIIGPSLKDAARRSPAIVVRLSSQDSKKLQRFFNKIWALSRSQNQI